MAKIDINVLKKNILEEAYKKLLSEYPDFIQFIVKYSIDEVNEDDGTAVGSFILLINETPLTIPIIFRDGNVDCTSYIGYEETGRFYALTKMLYNKLIKSISAGFGRLIDKKEGENEPVDKGVIGSLFATPNTFSPKVAALLEEYSTDVTEEVIETLVKKASYGEVNKQLPAPTLVLDLAYKSKPFAETLLKEASAQTPVGELLRETIGLSEIKKVASFHLLTKEASYTGPAVYTNRDLVLNFLPQSEQSIALQKLATQGFYVKNELHEKVASFKKLTYRDIFKQSLVKNLEETKSTGVWNVFRKDGDLETIVIAQELNDFTAKKLLIFNSKGETVTREPFPVGIKHKNKDLYKTIKMTLHSLVTSPEKANYVICVTSDNDVVVTPIFPSEGITKVNGKNKYVFSKYDSVDYIITDEVSRVIKNQGNYYLPYDRCIFVNAKPLANIPYYTYNDFDKFAIDARIELYYSPRDNSYLVNGSKLREPQLAVKLAHLGYPESEINEIIKTAKANPEQTIPLIELNNQMAALLNMIQNQTLTLQQVISILASLKQSVDAQTQLLYQSQQATQDMQAQQVQADQSQQAQTQQQTTQDENVTNQIVQLCQQLGLDPNQIIQQAQAQGMSMQDLLVQLQNAVQVQAQQPAQAQQTAQDMQAQQVQAQQAQNQEQQNSPQVDENGYVVNNLTPEILETLREISDKKILESALISYLASLSTPLGDVKQYVEDIKTGVNGLIRILLIVDTNYKKLLESVSDSVLSSFLNKGKSLAKKMTDFIIEVENI